MSLHKLPGARRRTGLKGRKVCINFPEIVARSLDDAALELRCSKSFLVSRAVKWYLSLEERRDNVRDE